MFGHSSEVALPACVKCVRMCVRNHRTSMHGAWHFGRGRPACIHRPRHRHHDQQIYRSWTDGCHATFRCFVHNTSKRRSRELSTSLCMFLRPGTLLAYLSVNLSDRLSLPQTEETVSCGHPSQSEPRSRSSLEPPSAPSLGYSVTVWTKCKRKVWIHTSLF